MSLKFIWKTLLVIIFQFSTNLKGIFPLFQGTTSGKGALNVFADACSLQEIHFAKHHYHFVIQKADDKGNLMLLYKADGNVNKCMGSITTKASAHTLNSQSETGTSLWSLYGLE